MNKITLALALIGAPLFFLSGVIMERTAEDNRVTEAWKDVLVVRGGTLIANPSAMSPAELADSQLIKRVPRLIGFGCEGGKSAVGVSFEEDDFQGCREIMSLERAQHEARTFEKI